MYIVTFKWGSTGKEYVLGAYDSKARARASAEASARFKRNALYKIVKYFPTVSHLEDPWEKYSEETGGLEVIK